MHRQPNGWLHAGDLRPGDRLHAANGHGVVVVGLRRGVGSVEVYTLTIAHDHTFFVGIAHGDKGYNCAPDEATIRSTGGVLVPLHKDNMIPNTRADQCGLCTFRLTIETVNSQLAAMGIARLHVRSVAGLEIKVHASLLALACLNVN